MKKFRLPTQEVLCMTSLTPGEFTQKSMTEAIKYLRGLGVPTYSETTEFDPEYPRILWDNHNITQTKTSKGHGIVVNSIDEFVALFELPTAITVENISDDYDARVYKDRIEVGCQTISAEKFKELINAAKEIGMID